nr:hypothetical protein [Polyangiaceae bacterium]
AFDGVDPADLPEAERAVARQLFGDVDRHPSEARSVLALLKGARVGGTWLCSLWLLYRALVAPLNGLAAGELAFAVVVAPDTRLARQAIRFALGAAKACPEIAPLVESQTNDGFVVRRPDGYRVQLEALPATRGGSALRGRTLVAALMDESSFFRDRDSGSVNDSELYRALIVRCSVPGAMLLVVSTAWLESGVLHELIGKNHPERGGRPASAVAAIAPTELMREGDAHIQRIVAEERERDPQNAAREFDCIAFSGGAGLFFDTQAVSACLVDIPHPLPPEQRCYVGAGVDPAFRSDAFAGVITRQRRNEVVFEVAELFERRPERGAPLVPSVVMGDFSKVAKRHGARALATDSFYVESVREHARNAGLSVYSTPDGQRGKARLFIAAREIIHGQRLHIPASLVALARQLREVVTRPTPGGGFSITSPRRRGAHGDLVSALVHSLWRAEAAARTSEHQPVLQIFGGRHDGRPDGVYEAGSRNRGKDYSLPPEERLRRFLDDGGGR